MSVNAPSPVTVAADLVEIWRTDDCAAFESVYSTRTALFVLNW